MIIVKPTGQYACEVLNKWEDGAIELDYLNLTDFENVLGRTKKFFNNMLVDMTVEEKQKSLNYTLRCKRNYLLTAFDKWEKAVLRGREADDAQIMEWYRRLLNLDQSSVESVPARIAYYNNK